MGVRITGQSDDYVAIYDSVTMTAFGPVFADAEQAEEFLKWLSKTDGRDARVIDEGDLHNLYSDFLEHTEQRQALEKRRDDFMREHGIAARGDTGEVWDILTSAFDDDDENEGGMLENLDVFADDHAPESVAKAWELYQIFHTEGGDSSDAR
jgi:hypothetical protein